MTVTVAFADATDGYVTSTSSVSYSSMRTGERQLSFDGNTNLITGQSLDGQGDYNGQEGFVRWPFTVPAGEVVTGAAVRFYQNTTNGLAVARDLEVRQYAYATPLSTAAWRSGSTLGSLPLLATVKNVQSTDQKFSLAGSPALAALLSGSGTVSTVIHSSRLRIGNAPTAFEQQYLSSADTSGTTNDPALIFTSVPQSTLFGVLAGQAQLSGGSWVVLESDGAATPTITLRRHTGSAVTTIGTVTGLAAPSGAQGIALAADASDNLYVIGRASSGSNQLAAVKWTKASGAFTWTAGSVVTSSLPAHTGQINQVAAAWHGTGGAGSLLVVAGHAPGDGTSSAGENDLAYLILSASTLAATIADPAPGAILPDQSPPAGYANAFFNSTGSGLDVAGSGTAGYVASLGRDVLPGASGALGLGRYDVSGSSASGAVRATATANGRKDASAKVRIVSTGASTVAALTADPASGGGITVVPYQATSSGWTALSVPIALDGQSIASMPSASALASSLAWDAIYLPRDNKLWIYYPDVTDGRIVRRTGVDLSTYQATREEVTVTTAGAAGGTNLAVRVARNASVTSGALLTVAHKASGGTLSTVYVLDSYNAAPTEPTLTSRLNFDATAAAGFSWTFNDPNLPSDGQTAYQLQIVRVSDSVTMVDTGKVASTSSSYTLAANTLSNGVSYQWRVRTYDQGDLVSPWSTYSVFMTGSGGTVTITSPAADNPAGVVTDDYDVSWSVAGTTQAQFRVWVTRDDTGATIHDSFITTGTQTTWRVTSMVSDVQHTIHVIVSNSSGVGSNEATRKILPSYGTPEKPIASVAVVGGQGYVLVSTSNPAPGTAGGTFPVYSFETDVSDVVPTACTIVQSTDFARSPTHSAKVTTSGTGVAVRTAASTDALPVTEGNRYTASFWAYSVAGLSNITCVINWKPNPATGTTISSATGPATNVPAGAWTYVSVTATAPAGAFNAVHGPGFAPSPATGTVFYVDDMTMAIASDRPVPTINQVWRRVAGSGEDWRMVGSAPVGQDFRDYTAAAGMTYEYRVEAVAP